MENLATYSQIILTTHNELTNEAASFLPAYIKAKQILTDAGHDSSDLHAKITKVMEGLTTFLSTLKDTEYYVFKILSKKTFFDDTCGTFDRACTAVMNQYYPMLEGSIAQEYIYHFQMATKVEYGFLELLTPVKPCILVQNFNCVEKELIENQKALCTQIEETVIPFIDSIQSQTATLSTMKELSCEKESLDTITLSLKKYIKRFFSPINSLKKINLERDIEKARESLALTDFLRNHPDSSSSHSLRNFYRMRLESTAKLFDYKEQASEGTASAPATSKSVSIQEAIVEERVFCKTFPAHALSRPKPQSKAHDRSDGKEYRTTRVPRLYRR